MNSTVYHKGNKLLIPILIILIIPAILAIYFSINPGTDENMPADVSTVNIDYSLLGVNETVKDSEAVKIYKSAVINAEKITADFRDVSNENPFVVTFTSSNSEEPKVYEFYMKYDQDECIYKTSTGEYFLLMPEDALKLLERTEFQSINKTATAPYAFAGVNAVTLTPTSGEWNHLNADGSYVLEKIDGSYTNDVPVKININDLGNLSFGAKTTPDSVNVKLMAGSTVKHDGAYENMHNSSVMSMNDAYYDMEITAVWDKKNDVGYHGTLVYSGQLFYDVSPTYQAVFNGTVIRGDFGIIKIQNFNEGEKLYVSSEFALPTELQVFTSAMGYSFAFLPVEYWTQGAVGSYDVTLSLADGTSQTVRIKVKDTDRLTPSSKTQEMLITDIELAKKFSEEAFTQFYNLVAEKTAQTITSQLWEGKFVYPNADNKKNRGTGMGDYGTLRTVNAGGLYTNAYYHNGIDFDMKQGESVLASNNGQVVFAGELDLTGNTVIIDHGCSILTYYGHLDSISVAEGDMVSKSGVIGKAGSTGFAVSASGATGTRATQVHFAVSVEGKFVTPYYLWQGGVNFSDET